MADFEDKIGPLRKNIQQPFKNKSSEFIKAAPIEGKIIENLKLLKSLIQSEKVKAHHLNEEEPKKDNSIIHKIQETIIDELIQYPEKDLAWFQIPKKYFDECFELLISAWRRLIYQKYSQILTFENLRYSYESFRAFIIALSLNVSLKALNLKACHLKEKELKLLSVFIKVHPTVTFLHLNNNTIGDKGLEYLFTALQFNSQLTDLSLESVSMSENSAYALAEAIKKTHLKTLNVKKNDLSNEAIEALQKSAAMIQCELHYD